jgi:hypothetical protein
MLPLEIMNWTGKVVVFSRSQLADVANRDGGHTAPGSTFSSCRSGQGDASAFYIGES